MMQFSWWDFHDAICMMRFAWCNLYDANCIMRYPWCHLHNAIFMMPLHDEICMIKFAWCEFHDAICLMQFALCDLHDRICMIRFAPLSMVKHQTYHPRGHTPDRHHIPVWSACPRLRINYWHLLYRNVICLGSWHADCWLTCLYKLLICSVRMTTLHVYTECIPTRYPGKVVSVARFYVCLGCMKD